MDTLLMLEAFLARYTDDLSFKSLLIRTRFRRKACCFVMLIQKATLLLRLKDGAVLPKFRDSALVIGEISVSKTSQHCYHIIWALLAILAPPLRPNSDLDFGGRLYVSLYKWGFLELFW